MSELPPIVDTHLHFWDLEKFHYPWLGDEGAAGLRWNYLPADWSDDAAALDIRATVHVQAEVDHALDPVAETRWLESLAFGSGGTPTVCVGYADLRAPELADMLSRHAETAMFRGIRQEAWFDPQSMRADVPRENLLDDPHWRAGLRTLASHGLSFDLLIWSHQLDQARRIFRELPDLNLVLEHTALPPLGDPAALAQWRQALRGFADELPWAVLKISGLGMVAGAWSIGTVADVVHEAVDIFGPHRCMLGSNFPVERRTKGYRELWQAYGALLAHLASDERAAIFGETAMRIYRIAAAAPKPSQHQIQE